MSMTYEERRAARQERIDNRVEKLRREAEDARKKEDSIASFIPMGQPILVGHHSERRHRSDLKKMQNLATKQVEASKEANRIANAGPTTAILASDSDAVERLREEVAQAEALQARMKAANPLARKKDVAGLMALGFSENVATRLTQPNVCGGIGFQPYQLSNNSANIRRMKQRLSYLESVKALKPTVKELPGGVRLEEDPEAVRLRLHFPGKPAANVIAALKSNGFRWAPSEGAWQRQLSNAARYAAQQVLKLVEAA